MCILALTPVRAVSQNGLSLSQAIDTALATSPPARIGTEQVAKMRADVKQAGLAPNPRLFLQSEDLRPWDHTFSFENSTEDYVYLSQTFELDGKRSKRVAYSRQGLMQADANNQAQRLQIAGRVADAYWSAAAAMSARDLMQKDLDAFDRIIHYDQQRVDSGAMAGVDLMRTQIERDRLMIEIQTAEHQARLAVLSLYRQIGAPAPREVHLTDSLLTTHPVTEKTVDEAIAQRPEVAAARDALNAAEQEVRLQKAYAVPDLDLLGGYKRDVGFNTLYGSLQIDLPFWNRNQGAILRSRSDVETARALVTETQLEVRTEVESAMDQYTRQRMLVEGTLPQMQDRARQNAAITLEAYRSGGADLLRLLDAERTQLETETLAVQTWAAYQRSVAYLHIAYGEQP